VSLVDGGMSDVSVNERLLKLFFSFIENKTNTGQSAVEA
jgi:hypothetical protein